VGFVFRLIASLTLSLVIAVDRVHAVIYPLTYRVFANRRRPLIVTVVTAWTYALVVALLMFIDATPETLLSLCLFNDASSDCQKKFYFL
jgi:hypothetical protein